jgi:mono/diheme cytochrome c family protein
MRRTGRGLAIGLGALGVIGCSRGVGTRSATPSLVSGDGARTQVESPPCRAPLGLDVVPAGDARSGSTVVLAHVHGRLLAYIADEDESLVRILDVEDDVPKELGSAKVPGRPGRMLMLPGGRLAVPLTDKAEVVMYTPAPLADDALDLRCTLDTPDEPVDLALTPDHETLLVVTDWSHTLVGFEPDSGDRRFEVDLPRSPRAVIASADGKHAYVAHATGNFMSVVDLRPNLPTLDHIDVHGTDAPKFSRQDEFPGEATWTVGENDVALVSTPTLSLSGTTQRREEKLQARSACQGFALAETTDPEPRILAPHVQANTGDITTVSSGYGSGGDLPAEIEEIGVVDEATGKTVKAVHDLRRMGLITGNCLLPRAAAVFHDSLYVACMGVDTVAEYDAKADIPVPRKNWRVGAGPTGLAMHGSRAVVWSQFAGTASILSLSAKGWSTEPVTVTTVRPTSRSEDEADVALGREIFHDTKSFRVASDRRACASCHPNGRDDGLVWSTPGGPRQTPMLAGRVAGTSPYGWDGAGDDLSKHLDHTLMRLNGGGLEPRERTALLRYVSSLPGPATHATEPTESLDRGREVFFAAGCASCHSAEREWTDGRSHDVSSRARADTLASFDTPSLRFASGTAPYFHDGRYKTLHDLLTLANGPMGAASSMPTKDVDSLESFVRSL